MAFVAFWVSFILCKSWHSRMFPNAIDDRQAGISLWFLICNLIFFILVNHPKQQTRQFLAIIGRFGKTK